MNTTRIQAVFLLGEDSPKRDRTTIVISNQDDVVTVGVKALTRVFEGGEGNIFQIHEEQRGDYRSFSKAEPISSIFDALKELFDILPETIDRTNPSDKA